MFDFPSVLLWAFATCVAAVMMASLIRRRREQLTGQLRDHVARQLGPARDSAAGDGSPEAADTPEPTDPQDSPAP